MVYNKLVEVTQWEDGTTPNHTYYTDNVHRMIGYQVKGEGPLVPFKSNLFSKKGRKFITSKVKVLPEAADA